MRLTSVIKNKDVALSPNDKELSNMRSVMEDRSKEILDLKLALKGNTLLLIISKCTAI